MSTRQPRFGLHTSSPSARGKGSAIFVRPGGIREDGFSKVWDFAIRHSVRTTTQLRREMLNRPERDEWYKTTVPELEKIEVPIVVCGSFPIIRRTHAVRSRSSAGWFAYEFAVHPAGPEVVCVLREEVDRGVPPLLEHTLKQIDNGWEKELPVRLAVYEEGHEPVAVLAEAQWPPDDLQPRTLTLDASIQRLTEDGAALPAAELAFGTRRGSVRFT